MKELEAKFTDIDPLIFREKLAQAGFVRQYPERFMRRKIFYLHNPTDTLYARIRDEGDHITMTIKNIVESGLLHGVQEAEIRIDDFEQGVLFLEMAGWKVKAYQETKREKWFHTNDQVEVVIDTWPGIPTFCEIEAKEEDLIRHAVRQLGLDWSKAFFGAVDVLYKHHLDIPHDVINTMAVITFENYPKAA